MIQFEATPKVLPVASIFFTSWFKTNEIIQIFEAQSAAAYIQFKETRFSLGSIRIVLIHLVLTNLDTYTHIMYLFTGEY